MGTHVATAVREGHWWVVDCGAHGVTQAKILDDAHVVAADLISVMTEADVGPADVTVTSVG